MSLTIGNDPDTMVFCDPWAGTFGTASEFNANVNGLYSYWSKQPNSRVNIATIINPLFHKRDEDLFPEEATLHEAAGESRKKPVSRFEINTRPVKKLKKEPEKNSTNSNSPKLIKPFNNG